MLARSLVKQGGGGGGAYTGPREGGSDVSMQGTAAMQAPRQEQKKPWSIDRMNPVMASSLGRLGQYHAHHEPNFRKAPLAWKAYHHPNMDTWAPLSMREPIRHYERATPGMWFAAGHMDLRKFPTWKLLIKTNWFMLTGTFLAYLNWQRRMHLNGYVIKNQGAVDGFS